ncbi:MAG TPA: hypothetical protein VG842_11025 [Sediminibacterium sp.]|nr:hypothetical protein [Sediminibacterium sp.]
MESLAGNDIEIRIRAFRSVDDPETCQKFIDGHRTVLEYHGVVKVTSSNNEWAQNPAVFVIVVESMDKTRLFGGARVHAADGKTRLPIEDATGYMDPKIYDIVAECAQNGTGELCGLWNSKEVAGLGVGSLFPSIASVVIAEQIGLTTMFSLCSPATVRFNQWIGSTILKTVGNEGTFYYPKLDLLATAVFLSDANTLEHAHPREREKMLWLRKNLKTVSMERSPFKNVAVKVNYDLEIAGADPNEFKIPLKANIAG